MLLGAQQQKIELLPRQVPIYQNIYINIDVKAFISLFVLFVSLFGKESVTVVKYQQSINQHAYNYK